MSASRTLRIVRIVSKEVGISCAVTEERQHAASNIRCMFLNAAAKHDNSLGNRELRSERKKYNLPRLRIMSNGLKRLVLLLKR